MSATHISHSESRRRPTSRARSAPGAAGDPGDFRGVLEGAIQNVKQAGNERRRRSRTFYPATGRELHRAILAVQRAESGIRTRAASDGIRWFRHIRKSCACRCKRRTALNHGSVQESHRKVSACMQRMTIALAGAAVGSGPLRLVHWRQESDFRPLYTTLAAEDAGAVVQKLKESGVDYRLSDNGSTILVPSAKVAEMRLELASAGLPKSGRIGFELFDKTNFGATEFVEHINYRRALEGELERTVMSPGGSGAGARFTSLSERVGLPGSAGACQGQRGVADPAGCDSWFRKT